VAKEAVLQTVTRTTEALNTLDLGEFYKLFGMVVINTGYPEIITIHTPKQRLANVLGSKSQLSSQLLWNYREEKGQALKGQMRRECSKTVWTA
jgi:hypothetical protein